MQYQILSPERFSDFELLDSGEGQKLERFGKYILIRPEPAAIWRAQLPMSEWIQTAHARFKATDAMKGKWEFLRDDMVSTWSMNYRSSNFQLRMECRITQFKHLGIFPEQASHWEYIFKHSKTIKSAKVLNLFAYTGGASFAADLSGAEVTHIDSVKSVVNWARENAELNNIDSIRWIVEDAPTFVEKEIRRGNKYHGIIMDPPIFGLGPKGGRWKLNRDLPKLLEDVMKLLDEKNRFFIMNTYSPQLSLNELRHLLSKTNGFPSSYEADTLGLVSSTGKELLLGNLIRF